MYYFYISLLIYGFLRSFILNVSILKSIKLLNDKYKSALLNKEKPPSRNYFILIPLLREQEILPDLLKTFSTLHGKYKLIFITTHKEDFEHKNNRGIFQKKIIKKLLSCESLEAFLEVSLGCFYKGYAEKLYKDLQKIDTYDREKFLTKMYDDKPLTKDLLSIYLGKMNNVDIEVVEYPQNEGVMAHQLNYACEYIRKKYPSKNNMVCIYNADSFVQRNYIEILGKISGNIVQQSSLFLKNFQKPSLTFRDAFLKGNGMLQSRWTLAHEIPRIYFQRESNPFNFLESSHVVGHGLAINLDTLKKVGDFPTQFFNEDLPLGYMLRVNNEFIDIYPLLENSDTPSTIKGVFNQYRVWFYGVAYYPKYFLYSLRSFSLSFKYKIYALLWAIRGFLRSFQWLFTSIFWVLVLLYPLLIKDLILFAIALFIFLFYSLFSWFLMFVSIKRNLEIFPEQKELEMSVLDWLSVFPVYLTHSWGLALGLVDVLKNMFLGSKINKRKTER